MTLEGLDISNTSVGFAKTNVLNENVDAELFQCNNVYEINKNTMLQYAPRFWNISMILS